MELEAHPILASGCGPAARATAAATGEQGATDTCRNCGCDNIRRRFKRRNLCGKCFYLFEYIKSVQRWDRSKPKTLKNIGVLRRRYGDASQHLDKMSDADLAAFKSNTVDQLLEALRSLRVREARRRGDARVDGVTIEQKLKDLLKVVQLRDKYDRVAGRFNGVSAVLNHAFSPEQCRILYSLLDDIEEHTYGQVTEGHKAFEAIYQHRKPEAPTLAPAAAQVGPAEIAATPRVANELWLVDFRHRVQSGEKWLHPLVIVDAHTRSVVLGGACASNSFDALRERLIEAFRRNGLPARVVVRHSQPRSTLTLLDVWLIEHDIEAESMARQSAHVSGALEVIMRRLRAELLCREFSNLGAADEAISRWSADLNAGSDTSGDPAPRKDDPLRPARPYLEQIVAFEYEPHDIIRRVQERGRVSLFGRIVRVPKSLRGKDVAFRPTLQDGVFDVLFRSQKISTAKVRSVAGHGGHPDREFGTTGLPMRPAVPASAGRIHLLS
jgi:hypothetical protein